MDSGQLLTLYFTPTQIFSGGKAQIYLHTTLQFNSIHANQLSNAISPPSWFLDVVTSTFARHSLNARNVINWKRNFKEK